ncbi:hypothetical protein SAY87_022628 [Trapa incisa]|uniref:Uncharacterized protein n=1 Tax=Trapa incisa TaxID=236973 RepID=A0AAN7Q4N8_9MYRT|nr:hypothetical protein SAY87_022628 [Trapa incisa]
MDSLAAQFFDENLPNVSVIREDQGQLEMQWKENDDRLSLGHAGLNDLVKTNFLNSKNLKIRDFVVTADGLLQFCISIRSCHMNAWQISMDIQQKLDAGITEKTTNCTHNSRPLKNRTFSLEKHCQP